MCFPALRSEKMESLFTEDINWQVLRVFGYSSLWTSSFWVWAAPSTTLTLGGWVSILRVKKLASKLHVHSVNFAAKLVHTRRARSSTVIKSHQEPVSGQACNPPDPHWFFLSFSRWRSFTVLGTKVAPFPWLMWGVAFTACVVFSFS